MSKVLLRLLVVIILIAGITTAVYFILNQPEKNKKLYDNYASLTKTEKYQDYSYITKEWTDSSNGNPTTLLSGNDNLTNHFRIASAIKKQIEINLLLINYANKVDETAQKSIAKKISKFNEKAYGKDGVSYQAKYLYNYYVNGNDVSKIAYLTGRLQVAFHEMELAGTEVLVELSTYVTKNVYNGMRTNDLKYVFGDTLALIASATASYQNKVSNYDELNSHIGKYERFIKNIETHIKNGDQNGYNTLGFKIPYPQVFNSVDRNKVYEMLIAEDALDYISKQNANDKKSLETIYGFMEATI